MYGSQLYGKSLLRKLVFWDYETKLWISFLSHLLECVTKVGLFIVCYNTVLLQSNLLVYQIFAQRSHGR